jgi:hypothetical protein
MPIVVEKKRRVVRTVKLIRPSPPSEVAVYGGRKAQPIEGPNLTRRGLQAWVLGGCEETFRRNWWTSQDFTEKEAKSAVASLQWNGSWSESAVPVRGRWPYSLWTDQPGLASYSPDVTYGHFQRRLISE